MFKYWGNCVVHFFIYFIFLCYSNSLWSTGKMKSWCVSKKEKRETEGGLTGLREMSFIWYDSELYAGVPVNILTYNIHNPVIVHVYNCNHTNENAAPSEHWCHSLNSCCFLFVCCLYYPFKTDLQLQFFFFLFFRSSLVGIKSANKFIKGLCD